MNAVINLFSRVLQTLLGRQFGVLMGLVALSACIWLVGPLLAVGAWRPLESEGARALAIGAVFGIWLLRVLYRTWRAAHLNAQLLTQIRTPAARTKAAPAEAEPHLTELGKRFDDAAGRLKTLQFNAPAGAQPRWMRHPWLQRFSRQYLYQLPWYVFIGAPGSGKTTALVNSGLEFPLAEQFGKAAIRGVGGTRNCDWWFTNEAVLIDTAGRYTTQESGREHDQGEWQGFVGLLKKFRPLQPLNGAILTISIADLLGSSEQERAHHALTLRKRLHELRSELGIQFPVYVLVTKIDLLAGFTEYFATLGKEERAQVWGWTMDAKRVGAPDFDLPAAFATEFKALSTRLYASLPEQLLGEHDPRQRESSYLLPQEFAGIEEILGQFLAHVFVASKFETNAMLRGVYFTSGTQEGTVFDRVLGGIKNFLRIDTGARAPQISQPGRSFFLRDLLQEVIFKEAALAGNDERWRARRHWQRVAGFSAAALVAVLLTAGWVHSYRQNAAYLDLVAAKLPALQKRIGGVRLSDREQVTAIMPVLDDLRGVPVTPRLALDHPPLGYRLGLYQGAKVQAASARSYERALDDILLPQLARRLEDGLRSADAANPDANGAADVEYSYHALKAYLMLFDTAHYDADYLQAWLSFDLERSLGGALSSQERDQLRQHLARLLAGRAVTSPYARDDALVVRTRERLLARSLAERVYGGMKRGLLANRQLPDFNVADVVGAEAPLVFRRASGASLNAGIPGIFSYRGYWELFAPNLEAKLAKLAEEQRWVLGARQGQGRDEGSDKGGADWTREVKRLYLNDYIAAWETYLGDLRLVNGANLAQNIQIARSLSGPDSPLVRIMSAAARETTLVRKGEIDSHTILEKARDRLDTTRSSLQQMFGQSPLAQGERERAPDERIELLVDNRFAPLRDFTQPREAGGKAPIAGVVDTLGELYSQLTATETALRDGATPPPNAVISKLLADAGRLPAPFRGMLGTLAKTSDDNVAHVLQQQMGRNVAANVGHYCQLAVQGRYPLVHSSARDMALGDFAQLFAPGALMDEFFQKNLAAQVDTAAKPWRFKGEQKVRAGYLASFEQASVIRDTFFAGGSRTPVLRLEMKPVQLDPAIGQIVIDIDGQTVRYAHGPQVATAIQWPGPAGRNQVRLQVSGAGGAGNGAGNGANGGGFITEGAWALHRLFDRATVSPGPVPEKMIVSFDLQGGKAVFEVTANSARNPFRLAQLNGFTCPGERL